MVRAIILIVAAVVLSGATANAFTVNRVAHTSMTKSGGWSSLSFTGSRTGTVATTSSSGQTLSFTASDTDFYLIAAPAETYDARVQVTVDGTVTKTINLRGILNHNPAGMAQETVTIYPLALGLASGSHSFVLTTLDAVAYKIDSMESKTGTIPLDNTKILGMGDSITYQGGSPTYWPNTFNGWLTQLCSYYGKTMVDPAEGSATIDQVASNYWNNVKGYSSHPYMMTLMAGVNDYFDGVTDTALIYRLGEIIDIVRSISPTVEIRMGEITYMSAATYPGGNATAAPMNTAIRQVATSKGVLFASTSTAYQSDSYVDWTAGSATGGGVHPNGAGHTLLFEKFRDAALLASPPPTAAVYRANMRASFR